MPSPGQQHAPGLPQPAHPMPSRRELERLIDQLVELAPYFDAGQPFGSAIVAIGTTQTTASENYFEAWQPFESAIVTVGTTETTATEK